MDTLKQILRGALFFLLAIFGMTMAFIFMISSAFAVAVLYVVARIKGRPFGAKAYWTQRHRPRQPRGFAARENIGSVIDVKMREL